MSTSVRHGPVVPAYFHPALAPQDWAILATVAEKLRLVVLNVASGAGPAPDSAFFDVLDRVREAGAPIAGYVDSAYGRRRLPDMLAEVSRYRQWYKVDGVFLDRAASGVEFAGQYQRIAEGSRALGARVVAFNHGTYPAREFAAHADLLGTFEGELPAFLDQDTPAWVHQLSADRFYQLLYATPAGVEDTVAALARERNVGSLYRTERRLPNPWSGLPVDFPHAFAGDRTG